MQDESATSMTPMPPPPPEEPRTGHGAPAGFWRRFGASLIDGILVGIVSTILRYALGTGLGTLLGFVVAAVYFTWFHGSTGRTPGNAALGITVVDINGGGSIGYGRALGRWAMSYVSAVVILIGYLWMLWDPKKQTWHDKVAGSLPVHTGSNI
ncbi:MAG TPA: RDD family protein [Gaiellaceae bacterium]|nr:RDD family protein [Gaiellaceae bacterium]